MQFSAKKKAGCPKVARDLNFPPRKDGILHPPSGCPGTPLPLPQSLYGQVGVCWRHSQNFSDRLVARFVYPWCSASSAITITQDTSPSGVAEVCDEHFLAERKTRRLRLVTTPQKKKTRKASGALDPAVCPLPPGRKIHYGHSRYESYLWRVYCHPPPKSSLHPSPCDNMNP